MRTLFRILIGLVIGVMLPCFVRAAPFAYITNTGSDNVSVIDMATNTVVATVPVGDGPFGIAVDYLGPRIYVANRLSNNVSVIDMATNTVVATVPVGSGPSGVSFGRQMNGRAAFVTSPLSGNVSMINAATNTVTATVGVGDAPTGIAQIKNRAFM